MTTSPVILLLGAKSTANPLASIPAELSSLKALLEARQADIPPFAIQYEPYFTQEQLKTTLDQLAGRVAILHFAGHSDSGALLSDDKAVYAQHLATHISTWSRPPDLIFLNGCHNAAQVEGFHAAGVPVVIATYRAINDAQAAGFAREFYASLLADGGQVALQAAFTRAGSKVLLSEARQARSLDIDTLKQDDAPSWDWSLFPRDPQALEWTLHGLLTHERPRFDANGELLNPYRGLEAFREEDRAYFFGREALSDELCDKIPATRLYALWGASGSGKSSLVSAGVIPRLREVGGWLILKTRPGNDPFRLLAGELALVFHPTIRADRLKEEDGLLQQLKADGIQWPALVADLLQTSGSQHLLLCIDQFEELFTQSDPATARAYEAQLIRLVEAGIKGCTLLLVMRADFLAAALANADFAKLLDQSPAKLLPPMGQAELRAAIEQPARKQRVTVEPALTAALLADVENQPGSLPLLQYALSLLWEQRTDDHLPLDAYNQFGGLEKALETRADSILDSFSAAEQEQAKHIFLRLIQPGEGSEDTRRRADLREFGDDPAARHILKALADARLITTQQDEHDRDAFAEVSHEALIRHWGKLREWLADNRDALRTQHQISKGAKDWEDGGRDAAWLLTGSRLGVAQEWLKVNAARASELETEFVKASIREWDRLALEKEQQRQRELALQEEKRVLAEQKAEEQRKSLKRTRWLSGIMAVITITMIVATGFAWHYANKSQAATLQAETSAVESRQKELEAKYNIAKAFEEKVFQLLPDEVIKGEKTVEPLQWRAAWLYGLEAAKQEVSPDKIAIRPVTLGRLAATREQDLSTERKQTPVFNIINIGSVASVVYSPDGKVIATGSNDKTTVRLWDARSGEALKILQGHAGGVRSVAYSPDGKVIATGSEDKTVRLWDASMGKVLRTLGGHTDRVNAVAFSPDGKVIATGSNDKTVRLWDAKSGNALKILQGHADRVGSVAYSPDGKIIATGSGDKTARLWDASTGKALKTLEGHTATVTSVVYSPDSKVIATGSGDKTVRLWDTSTGKVLRTLQGHTDGVNTVAYSPNGKVIASGSGSILDSADNTVRLWDIQNGILLKTLQGHTAAVNTVAYSPDGKILASGSESKMLTSDSERIFGSTDNALRLWDATTGVSLQSLQVHTLPVTSLAYSPDGKVIVSGSEDRIVRLWDAKIGVPLQTLQGHKGGVLSVAYSPDGGVIASGSEDRTVRLWDAKTGVPLQTLQGHEGAVLSVAYSPDGKVLASGSKDRMVRLWDAATGKSLQTLQGHTEAIRVLAYSPDGKVLASGSDDRTVHLWDTATGIQVRTLEDHLLSVKSLAYSPDGRVIVSGSSDGRGGRLWDTTNGNLLKTLQDDYGNTWNTLLYSPDGKVIASSSDDGRIRLYDATSGILLKTLQGHNSEVNVLAYSPDGKVIASGSEDRTVRLWDSSMDEPLKTLQCAYSVGPVMYSPDGKMIAVGLNDYTVQLWDVATGTLLETLEPEEAQGGSVNVLAYSPDGKVIAVGSDDRRVRLWDATTGVLLKTLEDQGGSVYALAYSPDGKVLASGSGDETVLWDATSGELMKTLLGEEGDVRGLAYSLDGKVLAIGTDDQRVRLWDVTQDIFLRTLQEPSREGHSRELYTLAYSPDGKVIASGLGDGTVFLWDVDTGKLLKTLQGHTGIVWSVAYSPDGKVLASSSEDKTVKLWNTSTGKLLNTLQGHTDTVWSVAYSPDGKVLASGSSDKTVRLWKLTEPAHRLLYDFDPVEVSAGLRFLWEMELDELDFKYKLKEPALLPQKSGYYFTFNEETRKLASLLDAPRPDETKLDQVVRFLEAECAYKDPAQKAACEAKKSRSR